MKLASWFITGAAFLAAPASAATLYDCAMTEAGNAGWISPELQVLHDEQGQSAIVMDRLINYYNNEKPMDARISASNANRVTFVWELDTRDSKGQNARIQYRATWIKARKRMNIIAVPHGYDNGFQGHGRCELSTR